MGWGEVAKQAERFRGYAFSKRGWFKFLKRNPALDRVQDGVDHFYRRVRFRFGQTCPRPYLSSFPSGSSPFAGCTMWRCIQSTKNRPTQNYTQT